MFTSPRRAPRGSIRLSASSPSSPKSRSGAAFTAVSTLSTRRSHTSSIATTLTQNLSAGPSPQTISSHQSSASASTMLRQRLDSKTANFWFGTLADRGRYRRRRHAAYSVKPDGSVIRKPHQPHYQSLDYNRLYGGIERW